MQVKLLTFNIFFSIEYQFLYLNEGSLQLKGYIKDTWKFSIYNGSSKKVDISK